MSRDIIFRALREKMSGNETWSAYFEKIWKDTNLKEVIMKTALYDGGMFLMDGGPTILSTGLGALSFTISQMVYLMAKPSLKNIAPGGYAGVSDCLQKIIIDAAFMTVADIVARKEKPSMGALIASVAIADGITSSITEPAKA